MSNSVQRQLDFIIRRDYFPHLYQNDLINKPAEERKRTLMSRGLAAMAVWFLTDHSPTEASTTVTDGYEDMGVDAVAVDRSHRRIYFVQAKWRQNENRSLDESDLSSFCDGIELISETGTPPPNRITGSPDTELVRFLRTPGYELIFIVVVNNDKDLPPRVHDKLARRVDRFNNRTEGRARFSHVKLSDLYKKLTAPFQPPQPHLIGHIVHSGVVSGPPKALHGRIKAVELGEWYDKHGNVLFDSNLRGTIEESAVNH